MSGILGCKKCGSPRPMSGPFYQPFNEGGYDCLRYQCSNCGYSCTTECADARANPEQKKAEILKSTEDEQT